MAKIHNNPKLKEPRMPFILDETLAYNWLNPINDDLDKKQIQEMIQSFPEEEMNYHTGVNYEVKIMLGMYQLFQKNTLIKI